MNLRQVWRRITTTRYARALEAEVSRQRAEVARQGAEIDRLRGENRALLNSILGIAGVPPILVTEPPAPLFVGASAAADARMDAWRGAAHPATSPGANGVGGAQPASDSGRTPGAASPPFTHVHDPAAADFPADGKISPSSVAGRSSATPLQNRSRLAAPLRRRSWHQINRMLEFESAKKAVTSD
ncbi:MAG TPA: hypothetical protein VN822_00770 [Candidatus Acidoferrales bacterium]|nr:hypothetical protein [Candidatus Acidoferrales bacterium]